MPTTGDEVHVDADRARAASTPNVVRWVLIISLVAAIVLLTAIWVIGAWSSDQDNQTVDAQIRAAEDNGRNDSIVGDEANRPDASAAATGQAGANVPDKDAGQ
jgi:hypothetical protein